ncbi:DNA repair protein RAD52 homolog isoform X5 [Diachasma alloeum]|uniref:DNA repair protein RAD52 homolog isoform X5 n=1 Tax=Diachasma alloeum TaxID=454923 RepID=UPI000738274B|nr:DNA repair protein RAD52 homolog isoform X5 [Diachasma alloeum]XP_015124338.1 DNA repair protein RAD52 homolog isoform X5 [Diachasma alloeum]
MNSFPADFVEYVLGKYQIGCAAFVRVQLADGTFHEELGYSNAESSTKGSAIYTARVSSITHGLKKALICFGGIIEDKISKIIGKKHRQKLKTCDTPLSTDNQIVDKPEVKATSSTIAVKRPKSPTESTDDSEVNAKPKEDLNEPPAKRLSLETQPTTNDKPLILIDGRSVTPFANILITPSATNKIGKSAVETGQSLKSTSTDEKIRLERKRKQKQKQEEFRKLMKEKNLKNDDQPSRY